MLFTLVVVMLIFINICASVMKRKLLNYSEIIFYYNSRNHSKYKAFLTKLSEMFLTFSFLCPSWWRYTSSFSSLDRESVHHRVDSVIESSLQEIIGSKNFALINLSWNFCETPKYDISISIKFSCSALTLYEIIKDFLKFWSCCLLGE